MRSNTGRKKGGNVGTQLYDGAAEVGKFMAVVGLIICGVIAFILVLVAIYLFATPSNYTSQVEGKITKASCSSGSKGSTECVTEVEYDVNGTKYTSNVNTSKRVIEGQNITLVYNPVDPKDAKQKGLSRIAVAWILIGIAVFIMLLSALHYYLVNRFKFLAAASGVGQGVSLITPNN